MIINGFPKYAFTREQIPTVHLFPIAIHCLGASRLVCDDKIAEKTREYARKREFAQSLVCVKTVKDALGVLNVLKHL